MLSRFLKQTDSAADAIADRDARISRLELRVAQLEKENKALQQAVAQHEQREKESAARLQKYTERRGRRRALPAGAAGADGEGSDEDLRDLMQSEFPGGVGSASIALLQSAEDSVLAMSKAKGDRPTTPLRQETDTHTLRARHEKAADGVVRNEALDFRDPSLFQSTLVLAFREDSPAYRRQIDALEENVDGLRGHLNRLVECSRAYCDAGKEFSARGREFSAALMHVGGTESWYQRLGDLSSALGELGSTIEEIQSYRDALLLALETTFCSAMEAFVKREVKGVRRLKAECGKCLEEHEQDLARLLSLRNDAPEDLRRERLLAVKGSRKRYELARFDLVHELNQLETKKKFQLAERVCSGLYADLGFFHQCHILMATLEPKMRDLYQALQVARRRFASNERIWAAKRKQLELRLEPKRLVSADRCEAPSPGVLQRRSSTPAAMDRSAERRVQRSSSDGAARGRGAAAQAKGSEEEPIERMDSLEFHAPSGPPTPSAGGRAPQRVLETQDSLTLEDAASSGDGEYSPSPSPRAPVDSMSIVRPSGEAGGEAGGGGGGGGGATPASRGKGAATTATPTSTTGVGSGENGGVVHSGFLWKRSSSVRKDWKRRWFSVGGGKLRYQRVDVVGPATIVCDVMLCTVRPRERAQSELFSFEILSPGRRTFVLQAESEGAAAAWISAIRRHTESLLIDFSPGGRAPRTPVRHLSMGARAATASLPEQLASVRDVMASNPLCVDCGAPHPDWCSINIGATMCIECSGVHRSLGTQVSRVRSLTLDVLPPSISGVLLNVGNARANRVFEARVDPARKITPQASREEREAFIRDKYVRKAFAPAGAALGDGGTFAAMRFPAMEQRDFAALKDAQQLLLRGAAVGDMLAALLAITAGADVNAKRESDGRTAAHCAAEQGMPSMLEFLFQNGANLDATDSADKAPLDYATEKEHVAAIALLLEKLDFS